MSNKVDAYIAGLYRSSQLQANMNVKRGVWFSYTLYAMTLGLSIWGLFYGGPAIALRAANILTWVVIVLSIVGFAAILFSHYLRIKMRRMSDRIADTLLFTNTRANPILKLISSLPLPTLFICSIFAGWSIAAVFMGVLIFLEIANKSIVKINQDARRAELEEIDASVLSDALVTEQDLREQIEDVFRKNRKSR